MNPTDTPSMLSLKAYGSSRVLAHGDEIYGDELGARDVWVWMHDGRYFMHYDAAGETGWLAALATSDDGLTWQKHGPVLSLGGPGDVDSASASYGTVFGDGERWHMFYLGTPNAAHDGYRTPALPYSTLKAEAPSPFGPWRKQREIIPFRPEKGTWYDDTASPGQVLRHGDGYIMLFSAATTIDGQIKRTLGLARTNDLDGSWSVDPEPALPLDEQIENSSLYFEEVNGLWFLFTNHVGVAGGHAAVQPQNSSEYTDAVWVYWSEDPTRWTADRRAVVIEAADTGWSPRVVGLPSVVVVGDRLAVYYDGCMRDSIDHGLRDIGVSFLDLPLTPPLG